MAAFNVSDCVAGRLVPKASPNATYCECQVFYQGTHCEQPVPWFPTLHYVRIVYSVLLMVYLIVWALLKIAHMHREGRGFNRKRLSLVALAICLLACFVYKLFKSVYVLTPEYWYSTGAVFITKVLLPSIYIALFMASTNMILGFWFEVLNAKMRPQLALRTKLASIVGGVVVLFSNPIGSLLSQLGFGLGFLVLIVFPLLGNAIIFIVMTSIIGCKCCRKTNTNAAAESKIGEKTQYAINIFGVLSAFWTSYCISIAVIAIAYVIFPAKIALVEIISGFYNDTLEFVVGLCVMLLVDRHGGVVNLFRALFLGYQIPDSRSTRTATLTISGAGEGKHGSKTSSSKSTSPEQLPFTTSSDYGVSAVANDTKEVEASEAISENEQEVAKEGEKKKEEESGGGSGSGSASSTTRSSKPASSESSTTSTPSKS